MAVCRYCEQIHAHDSHYPLREAFCGHDTGFPRCAWHWRFTCDLCRRADHFNGIAYCERSQKFICINCKKGPSRTVWRRFWGWRYYYQFHCKECGRLHPALDRLEYLGQHPWQRHRRLVRSRRGLCRDRAIPPAGYEEYAPLEKAHLSERTIAEHWNRAADAWHRGYTAFGDRMRQYIIDPSLLRLLGPVSHSKVLDAGCGNGYLARRLAKRGADVWGVDVSARFIELARAAEEKRPLGIHYGVASLTDLSGFHDGFFDKVVSNIVLSDVLDHEEALKEIHRVLKPAGTFVFSIMHPCFASAPIHGWVKAPPDTRRKEELLYWKVDRYFERSMSTWQYGDLPPLVSFHRTLSDYLNTVIAAGFEIQQVAEPRPSPQILRRLYVGFADDDRIPLFLIIKADSSRLRELN